MAEVQLNIQEIRKALEHDAEFFVQFFLHDELDFPVPEFHKEIFFDMTDDTIDRLCLAIPRGHAKTTLAKLATVWYLLFSPWRFIIYVSNTAGVAIPAVNDIMGFITSDNFRSVFGDIEWEIKRDGTGLYKFKLNGKTCILKAFGSDQQVRGVNVDNERPQFAVIDDLEDNKNIATEQLFINLKRNFFGPLLKALNQWNNKILWLGNMISRRSMLYENCQSDYWHSKRFGCILEDGTPLWPDLWPLEKLKADFIYYQEQGMADVWFAEMMNMPIASGSPMIKAEEIPYLPAIYPEDAEFSFITVDLAISDKTWADHTVVAVHSWTGEQFQISQIDGWKGMDPVRLFDILIQTAFRWRVTCIGIENVAYQKSLQYIYPHFCRERGIVGIEFVELKTNGQQKAARIIPWAGMLKDQSYALTQGDIVVTEQLLNFDPTKKDNEDDYIDACAYGPQMMQRYATQIMRSSDIQIEGEVLDSYQICTC